MPRPTGWRVLALGAERRETPSAPSPTTSSKGMDLAAELRAPARQYLRASCSATESGPRLPAAAAGGDAGQAGPGRPQRRRDRRDPRAHRVLETSHPPVYYVPREDIAPALTAVRARASASSRAAPATSRDRRRRLARAPPGRTPTPRRASSRSATTSPSTRPDGRVHGRRRGRPAQPGDFYGGWITAEVVGPFKGEPGTWAGNPRRAASPAFPSANSL